MKTFAVIGLGRFGRTVASQLFSMGYEVLAVDINEELVNDISPFVTHAAAADAKDEAVLKELGVRNYDCAVVGITENLSDSILITLLLKEMGVKRVLCKALDENHKKILDKIGADYVIIPEDEVGVKTALHLASNSFFDWAELSSRYGIEDIEIPKEWRGKTLLKLDIRKKYGVNVIAVKSRGSEKVISPSSDYVFAAGDIAVIAGENECIRRIKY